MLSLQTLTRCGLVALAGCSAWAHPAPVAPGTRMFEGTVPLAVTNGGRAPVCDVTIAASYTQEYLVCDPKGVELEENLTYLAQDPPICKSACLAPGASVTFSVRAGTYGVEGTQAGSVHLHRGFVEITGPTRLVLGVSHPAPRAGEQVVGVNTDTYAPEERAPLAPEDKGPCTPTGQVYTGTPCCGGWVGYDQARSTQVCTDH